MHEIISWLPAELASLPRYVVALAIGLLMGLERERNPAAKAGLRTFALTALLGVLAAHLGTALDAVWLIPVGLLLVGAMMIAAYLRDPVEDGDPGTTTVAALMLCYGLGVLVWHDEIQLAVMLGIAATMLLYFTPAGSPSRARRSCWDRRRSPGSSARSPGGMTTGWSCSTCRRCSRARMRWRSFRTWMRRCWSWRSTRRPTKTSISRRSWYT